MSIPVGHSAFPQYFEYYASPVKVIEDSPGRFSAWQLSAETGAWERADIIAEILEGRDREIHSLTVRQFVERAERYRVYFSLGEGDAAVLYETLDAIIDVARSERRALTLDEEELVWGIMCETYRMSEEKLAAEGNPVADPDLLDREG